MEIYRGDVVIADLEPVKGSEQGGKRPVLIIQNDVLNKHSPVTIIAPFTSRVYEKEYPTNVFLSSKESGLKKDSTILLNQIRAIDKSRIRKRIKKLDYSIMREVDLAIKISLGIN